MTILFLHPIQQQQTMVNNLLLLRYFAIGMLLVISLATISQEPEAKPDPGKVYGKIYSNFYTELNEGDNQTAFEIRRAYFGYERKLGSHFKANVKLDIGSPDDISEFSRIRRYAYFKNAYLAYQKDKLTSYFGIIDLMHFKIQEKYWAHRYIEKSFADAYRFGSSADLGWLIQYDWTDWISLDFTMSNGEGYSQLQTDNTFRSAVGVSLYPGYNLITRLYYDWSEKDDNQSTASLFLGYKLDHKFIGGVEYNYRFNDDYTADYNMYGYSAFASWFFIENWQVFGRYDKLSSNILDGENIPWNLADDGSKIIAGIEYSPISEVKLALDYQDWFPYANNAKNEQFIFLNVEVSF